MRTIAINGVDLRDGLGIHTNFRDGLGDVAAIDETTGQIPGRAGAVIDSDQPTTSSRDLSIAFDVKGSSLAVLEATLEKLRALVSRGTLEVVIATAATRAYYARLRQLSVSRVGPAYATTAARGSILLRCLDPYAYDLQPIVISVPTAVDTACPTGTAPCWPLIRQVGPATGPTTFTLKSLTGATLATLVLTGDLTSAEYRDIDMAAQTITKYSSGVSSDAYSTLSSGDFFALPSQDPTASGFPQVRVSAGTGFVFFKRAWL